MCSEVIHHWRGTAEILTTKALYRISRRVLKDEYTWPALILHSKDQEAESNAEQDAATYV